MHRIDSSTATPDNRFTEGDPTIPVAATTVTADWLNAVQEEIVKVVLESGQELDKADTSQLWQAIGRIIGVKAPIATTRAPGLVQVGSGLAVTAAGLLSVLVATAARAGIIKPDGTSLTVDENGVLSVIQKADSAVARLEVLRKLSIGAPKFHRSTVPPADHAWPDGSFIEFDDWPEFGEVYEQGGFTGMLLPWDADTEERAANLGKFRPNAANPTGLYLPLHGGQFFRNWALGQTENAGSYNAPGLPNIQGSALLHTVREGSAYGAFAFSSFTINQAHNSGNGWGGVNLSLDASRSNAIYGASLTVMPASIDQPVIIYLGRPR